VGQACDEEGQEFVLFSDFLQQLHGEPRPSPAAQAALLRLVQAQGDRLQAFFAIPALIACLRVSAPMAKLHLSA